MLRSPRALVLEVWDAPRVPLAMGALEPSTPTVAWRGQPQRRQQSLARPQAVAAVPCAACAVRGGAIRMRQWQATTPRVTTCSRQTARLAQAVQVAARGAGPTAQVAQANAVRRPSSRSSGGASADSDSVTLIVAFGGRVVCSVFTLRDR